MTKHFLNIDSAVLKKGCIDLLYLEYIKLCYCQYFWISIKNYDFLDQSNITKEHLNIKN